MKNIFISPAIAIGNSFNRIISFSLSLFFISIGFLSFAQAPNTWTQKANFAGSGRQYAVGFSIGNKGYLGTGEDGGGDRKDFWEYDHLSDIWTQKADFGGTARVNAVGFSIGNKGYIGTGNSAFGRVKDFWEYDPTSNAWTQKADFGGGFTYLAVGFTIGSKGYIGTGYDGNSLPKNDFWEYDPLTDTWTSKANFGGSARYWATGFSIGNKGYIGTGNDGTGKNDFWEWDQATNIWTQKTNFGGTARFVAVGFSIGNKGYIGLGTDSNGNLSQDFWEWNQSTDTWVQKTNFGVTGRYGTIGFSLGDKGYIGTGYNHLVLQNDFWEYTPEPGCPGTLSVNADTDKTVYYGYAPEQCTALNGSASGGASPYQYSWNTGATTASISVCPTDSTAYTLTVTDANGCSKSDQVSVKVIDVRCNDKGKVTICHNPGKNQVTICVSPNAVESQLANGDLLGTCGIARRLNLDAPETEKPMTLYPNPGSGLFSVEVCKNNVIEEAKIEIKNSIGQIVYSKIPFKTQGCIKETIEFNNDLPEGMYFLNLIIGEKSEIRKLILTK